MDYCQERQQQLAGSPYWHSEALTPDGKMMFVHFQNVLMNKGSGTLMGLSSGILVHAFDQQQKINRWGFWAISPVKEQAVCGCKARHIVA